MLILGDVAILPLTQGKVATLDKADLPCAVTFPLLMDTLQASSIRLPTVDVPER